VGEFRTIHAARKSADRFLTVNRSRLTNRFLAVDLSFVPSNCPYARILPPGQATFSPKQAALR